MSHRVPFLKISMGNNETKLKDARLSHQQAQNQKYIIYINYTRISTTPRRIEAGALRELFPGLSFKAGLNGGFDGAKKASSMSRPEALGLEPPRHRHMLRFLEERRDGP